jgi:hypothetical protein
MLCTLISFLCPRDPRNVAKRPYKLLAKKSSRRANYSVLKHSIGKMLSIQRYSNYVISTTPPVVSLEVAAFRTALLRLVDIFSFVKPIFDDHIKIIFIHLDRD